MACPVAIYDAPDVNAFATGMNKNTPWSRERGLLNGNDPGRSRGGAGPEITQSPTATW